ncbi:MAG: hypothetical protein MUP21_05435 [Dehalococcoidia bacterium]|nr:hypothetical protein [Dehalococcoidia bacterium]
MVKVLGGDWKREIPAIETLLVEMGCYPEHYGFRAVMDTEGRLLFDLRHGGKLTTLTVSLIDGDKDSRWICLVIKKTPEPPTFADVAYARKAVFGPRLSIIVHPSSTSPTEQQAVTLWHPLQPIHLPPGIG